MTREAEIAKEIENYFIVDESCPLKAKENYTKQNSGTQSKIKANLSMS